MKWFRLYHDMIDDPKIAMMSESEQLLWVRILCLASMSEARGVIMLSDDEIAFRLRISIESWKTAKDKFRCKGLVDPVATDMLRISGWDDRQFESDSSTARVAAHRAKKKGADGNVTATLQPSYSNVGCNADVTRVTASDTDPDSDPDPKKEIIRSADAAQVPPDPPKVSKKETEYTAAAFDKFWKLVPLKKEKEEAKKLFCRKAGHQITLAEMTACYEAALREHAATNPNDPKFQFFPRLRKWIGNDLWRDEAVREYLSQPSEPVTPEQSAELDEWISLIVKAGHVKDAKIAPSGGIRVQYLNGVWGSGSAMLKQHPVESLKAGYPAAAKRLSSATLSRVEGTQTPAMVEPSIFESSDALGVF
jgi:N-terminal phage replisome organiser (Phage_rep_org_N)